MINIIIIPIPGRDGAHGISRASAPESEVAVPTTVAPAWLPGSVHWNMT